ncbi:MAG: hypothetical protein M3178_10995 [Pseudomonadota bacterium]|nr:hypothetical protein [Pseudomonadota bacterium]
MTVSSSTQIRRELSPDFGDALLGQAASFSISRAHLHSLFEAYIGDEFWQQVLSVETSPGCLRAIDERDTSARAVLFDNQPFERIVR